MHRWFSLEPVMEKRDTARVACRLATLCGKFNRATVCGESCGNGFLDTGSIPVGSTIGATIFILLLSGGIAQLGERLNGIQEVSGSIPLISTRISARCAEIHIAFHLNYLNTGL